MKIGIIGAQVTSAGTWGAPLSREMGYEVVDCGPLHVANELEHLAALWIRLAYTEKLGGEIAFELLR